MREERIERLKGVLMEYLGDDDRHYEDKTRLEQSVENLAQALHTRLCQLLLENRGRPVSEEERRRLDLGETFRTLGMAAEAGLLDKVLNRANRKGIEDLNGLAAALRKQDLANFLADSADTDLALGKIGAVEEAMEKKRR